MDYSKISRRLNPRYLKKLERKITKENRQQASSLSTVSSDITDIEGDVSTLTTNVESIDGRLTTVEDSLA